MKKVGLDNLTLTRHAEGKRSRVKHGGTSVTGLSEWITKQGEKKNSKATEINKR